MSIAKRLGSVFSTPIQKLPSGTSVNISCVVDDRPDFRMQAWNWILSLLAVQTHCRIFIHHLPEAFDENQRAKFQALGATLVEVRPFGDGSAKYCNKVRQLETEAFLDADFVILSDADIVFLQDPALLVRAGMFRAKVVDGPNPPDDIITELMNRVGIDKKPSKVALELFPGQKTFHTNLNGGLYIMPSSVAKTIMPLWEKHARFCLGQEDLLGSYLHHSDQLGMGLALNELDAAMDQLPTGANLPTHLSTKKLKNISRQEISAIHYHGNIDDHGLPQRVGIKWIDKAVDRMRASLVRERRNGFLNDLFWDFRYAQFPELGSGRGSRGADLLHKQNILLPYIEMIDQGSILDVGCGDLELFASFPALNFTGIDVSEEAIAIAKKKRPDWTFQACTIDDIGDASFDYAICIDVLIHQPTKAAAQELVESLVRVARKGVIFSTHSERLQGSGISFDSGHMQEFMGGLNGISEVLEIAQYRDVSLYLAVKGDGEKQSPHDIGLQELAIGASYSEDSELLRELVTLSREKVGFFPRTVIRTHEYPWFARQMRKCAGKRILDVGAGVCCLPFYLADRGADVTTIDKHSRMRNKQQKDKWNEWGFLDYSLIDSRIKSFNEDMSTFEAVQDFDVIYSVSVLEHMPAHLRRCVVNQISTLLKPNGQLLLSLDLVPGGELLWNLDEGKVVDESNHGTFETIKDELVSCGFEVESESIIRDMPQSRTDVAYLMCRKLVG